MADRRRLVSGVIALGYLQAMWSREGWPGTLALLILLAVPLGMIWYSGTISRSKGWGWTRGRIDRTTPALAIRALGWVLLLAPLAVLAALWLRSD